MTTAPFLASNIWFLSKFQTARYSLVCGACYRKPSSKSKSPSAENVIYFVNYSANCTISFCCPTKKRIHRIAPVHQISVLANLGPELCVRALSAYQVSVTWCAARQSLCVSSRWVGASSGSLSSFLRAMPRSVPAPSTFVVCVFSKREVLCCFRCLLQKAKLQK